MTTDYSGKMFPFNMFNVNVIFIIILECPSGSYGVACNAMCGNCRDINKCDHVNGTCPTGCGAGYIGDLCKNRE